MEENFEAAEVRVQTRAIGLYGKNAADNLKFWQHWATSRKPARCYMQPAVQLALLLNVAGNYLLRYYHAPATFLKTYQIQKLFHDLYVTRVSKDVLR
jgi:hypothetical protein